MTLVRRIRDRKLVRWLAAYLAGAWLVLQVVTTLADAFGWPDALLRAVPVILAVGFLAAVVVSWYHGEKGAQRVSAVEVLMLCGILVLAGSAVAFVRDPATGPGASAASAPAVVEHASIAVLPFDDMSAGADQEYFADGLTEELLNVLAQIPELRVAARTSSFAFKGAGVAIDSIARALRVAYVLEGSLRTDGDRLRITAQLIDARTGYHLWSEAYDRRLDDVFRVQDEISRAIVDALQVELTLPSDRPLVAEATADGEAHTLFLKGMHTLRGGGGRPAVESAVTFFHQAIARDSAYADAYAGLAATHRVRAYRFYGDPGREYDAARAYAERALALDPRNVYGLNMLSNLAAEVDWEFATAEAYNRRALDINPGLAQTWDQRAWLLMMLRRSDEAIAAARRAAELDPVSASPLITLGAIYNYSGRPAEALEPYRAAVALAPGDPVVLNNLGLGYAELGRLDEAIAAVERGLAAGPEDPFLLSTAGFIYARAGRRDDALQALQALQASPAPSPYLVATIHAGLGDADRVFHWLDRALDERDYGITELPFDPCFDQFRDDPRMHDLLRRAGVDQA